MAEAVDQETRCFPFPQSRSGSKSLREIWGPVSISTEMEPVTSLNQVTPEGSDLSTCFFVCLLFSFWRCKRQALAPRISIQRPGVCGVWYLEGLLYTLSAAPWPDGELPGFSWRQTNLTIPSVHALQLWRRGTGLRLVHVLQWLVVQLLSCLWLFANPMNCSTPGFPVYHQLPSLLKLLSIESVMPSNHLIFCRPLLLLPSAFPSIRVFSSKSFIRSRWPKFWSFSFSISPSSEHSRLISFRIDWFDLLAFQGTLKESSPTPQFTSISFCFALCL